MGGFVPDNIAVAVNNRKRYRSSFLVMLYEEASEALTSFSPNDTLEALEN